MRQLVYSLNIVSEITEGTEGVDHGSQNLKFDIILKAARQESAMPC